jgi:pimeloyl-ACP methyl ester carboxylesterase
MPETREPIIVLVHGAWADANSWAPVLRRLQRHGHSAVAIANNLRGPASDAGNVRAYLETIEGPIVLVAHSYGGFVITNAATGVANVKALVYVDAFIPDEGQTGAGLTAPDSAVAPALANPTSVFKLVPYPGAPQGVVDTYLLPDVVTNSFANDLSPDDAALVYATQRPLSTLTLAEPSGAPAWKGIPAWAVIGTQDQIIPPAAQRAMAEHAGAKITEVAASHVSMLSHPDEIVDVIENALRAVSEPVPA